MFKLSPGRALVTFNRVYTTGREASKSTLFAEHTISDTLWKQQNSFLEPNEIEPAALEQMDILSRRKEWWARLYVAKIMRQHPAFRQSEVVERLKRDKHPLIREAMTSITTKKQEKDVKKDG